MTDKPRISAPLAGYVTDKGKAFIRELEKQGYDTDLAFSVAELLMSAEDFYSLPGDRSEQSEDL